MEIIRLNEIKINVENIDESGNNPLINERIKAEVYYRVGETQNYLHSRRFIFI